MMRNGDEGSLYEAATIDHSWRVSNSFSTSAIIYSSDENSTALLPLRYADWSAAFL